jgi:phosphotransferase family enzyme
VPRFARSESVRVLLARASDRVAVRPEDGKSQSTFERVTIEGERYFLKRLSPSTDWVMRVTGDHVHRPYLVWRTGVMDHVPACIDHTVVAMEIHGAGDDAELSVLMRDVGSALVPAGNAAIARDQHARFIDHLAELSVAFWDWQDTVGCLTTMDERFRFFDTPNVARELAVAEPPEVIVAAGSGWRKLNDRAPALAEIARAVQNDPTILTAPLAETPVTFLHGDWKLGNLGSHQDGRTILLDWAYPGAGPPCWDLCWYLALNAARLPESKESTIARFRSALDARGIRQGGWFDRQLDLCTIGIMATFAWEKALGDEAELRWWESRVLEAVARQGVHASGLAA